MGNKEIQEERIRGYFIQATKEILKAEGLNSLSVRNIAQKAGYSYATIYNYFRDVKDLVFECVKDFQDEAEAFIKTQVSETECGISRIKGISLAYINYFVEYPGIFELFYIEKVYNLAGKQPTINLINTFLERQCEEDWKFLTEGKKVTTKEVENTNTKLLITVTGMLLLYLHRQYPIEYKDFMENASREIDEIMGSLGKRVAHKAKNKNLLH